MLACALVSHSWASQRSIISSEILLDTEDSCYLLENILRPSPHLLQHIRRLAVRYQTATKLPVESLSKICDVPFAHLTEVGINYYPLTMPAAKALCQLLSLPTIRSVELRAEFTELTVFMLLWKCCPPRSNLELILKCSILLSPDPIHPTHVRFFSHISAPVTASCLPHQ